MPCYTLESCGEVIMNSILFIIFILMVIRPRSAGVGDASPPELPHGFVNFVVHDFDGRSRRHVDAREDRAPRQNEMRPKKTGIVFS